MKWLVWLLALPFALMVGGLWVNKPLLLAPPGLLERLKTYLTTHVAETAPNHPFAELQTPCVPADLPRTRAAVLSAMAGLGWQEIRDEPTAIHATVVTRLLRFRDDVTVTFETTDEGTRLHARSASRVGRGDLGANARHLRDLFAAFSDALHSKS